MPFRVSEQGDARHKIISLEDVSNGTRAEIFAFGALLNVFSVLCKSHPRNIIEAFQNTEDAIENITPAFQGAKLSPFVCRLKEGQYTFANKKHKIEKYYYQREALHGLLYDAEFSVAETVANEDSACVVLTHDYNKNDPGFPFFYRIEITYRLQSGNDLSIMTKVINLSSQSIPMSDGWHPYFSLGKPVNDLDLFINAKEILEFDSRLLPTGNLVPFQKFSLLQKIGNTQLDNSFLLQQNGEPACILRDGEDGLQLSIHPDAGYPYLQIYIPDHRKSIAIENLSSVPDAFNNGIGLTILEPSESKTFTTRFVVTTVSVSS